LLGALAATAELAGIERVQVCALRDNWPVRRIVERWGVGWVSADPGVLAATIDLATRHQTPHLEVPPGVHDATRHLIAAFG
jgi:hypothetical protein